VFVKTRTKYALKDGIELAVFKAFREVLIEVLSFGFGVAVLILAHLLAVLLIDGFYLVHSVIYDAHKQAHN
jgi:predicted RND superfamily exporter protein